MSQTKYRWELQLDDVYHAMKYNKTLAGPFSVVAATAKEAIETFDPDIQLSIVSVVRQEEILHYVFQQETER